MLEEPKRLYLQKNIEVRYIIINVLVFLILKVGSFFMIGSGYSIANDLLSLPSSFSTFLSKPWTLVSYMFTHIALFHLLSNMVWLYFGGRIFSDLLGTNRFIKTYWMGGLIGALFYLIAYNFIPGLAGQIGILKGASASVMAVFIAIAVYMPNYTVMLPIIGPAKLKYIAIVFVIFMLPSSYGNTGGHIAHLGGLTWGVIWATYLKKGIDLGQWFDALHLRTRALVTKSNHPRQKPQKTSARTSRKKSNSDLPNQEEIDRILDKVGKSGYDSLTDKEKEILFKVK